MRIKTAFAALVAFIVLGGVPQSLAQKHAGYCDEAKSTAEIMACVNLHNSDAQVRLNEIYKLLQEQQDEPGKAALAKVQKAWIDYRDAHCPWESSRAEAPGLERLSELSCLALLTEERTAVLEAALKREESTDTPREFGENPRWINVLADENPDTFWRYGQWISADFDCDGQDEYAVTGINVKETKAPAGAVESGDKAGSEKKTSPNREIKAAPVTHGATLVLAVVENPITGRPKLTTFSLPVTKSASGPSLCSANAKLAVTVHPAKAAVRKPAVPEGKDEVKTVDKAAPQGEVTEAVPPAASDAAAEQVEPASGPICQTALQITDGLCPPLLLYWSGKSYDLKQSGPSPEKLP